jgi:hypothetical protein
MSLRIPVHLGKPAEPAEPLAKDWFGQPARFPARFSLQLRQGVLRYAFRVDKPPQCDMSHSSGAFVEGLWEQDVAELFLMSSRGEYHELNIAPSGAWWSASFSSYRQRREAVRCPSVRVRADHGRTHWAISLTLDLRDLTLLETASLDAARLNVCAILSPEDPEYLCYGHTSGGEPDFHAETNFLPPQFLPRVEGKAHS